MPVVGIVLVLVVAVIALPAVAVVIARTVNRRRFPETEIEQEALERAIESPGGHPNTTIATVRGRGVDGYSLHPHTPAHRGLVMTFGGSDGGADDELALQLAEAGFEVMAMHFFGQPDQPPVLNRVPLEFFGEVLDHARTQGISLDPLTVVGSSKGAELALLLPTYYPQIHNVVVFTPSEYVYQGLDFRNVGSSWTWAGAELPYISFRSGRAAVGFRFMLQMILGLPTRLRETYVSATERDPEASRARIDVSRIRGRLLAFAGGDDHMWPGDAAARHLAAARPENTEIHIYPGAGHVFGLPGWHAHGFDLGGTAEANAAARADSADVLRARLAEWHG